jgi:hypothetical protein
MCVITDLMQCLHDAPTFPAVATDQYRMQSQSHEIFALGLTTESEATNENVLKEVMEKTIMAIGLQN